MFVKAFLIFFQHFSRFVFFMKNALLLCCAANETHSQEPALFEYVPRRLYSTSVRNYISRISLDKIVLIATHVVSDVEYIAKNVVMFKKGVIVDNAAPHELLRKIDGKVWELYSTEEDLPALQNKYRVTNIARDENAIDRIIVRVLSDETPSEPSKSAAPTLEDYYLYVFGAI